jgi:hypothetical protein
MGALGVTLSIVPVLSERALQLAHIRQYGRPAHQQQVAHMCRYGRVGVALSLAWFLFLFLVGWEESGVWGGYAR